MIETMGKITYCMIMFAAAVFMWSGAAIMGLWGFTFGLYGLLNIVKHWPGLFSDFTFTRVIFAGSKFILLVLLWTIYTTPTAAQLTLNFTLGIMINTAGIIDLFMISWVPDQE